MTLDQWKKKRKNKMDVARRQSPELKARRKAQEQERIRAKDSVIEILKTVSKVMENEKLNGKSGETLEAVGLTQLIRSLQPADKNQSKLANEMINFLAPTRSAAARFPAHHGIEKCLSTSTPIPTLELFSNLETTTPAYTPVFVGTQKLLRPTEEI